MTPLEIFFIILSLLAVPFLGIFASLYFRYKAEFARVNSELKIAREDFERNSREHIEMLRNLAIANTQRDGALKAEREAKESLLAMTEAKVQLERNLAAADERFAGISEKLAEREESEKKMREKLAADFEILSNRIFETARERLTSANAEKLGAILAPLASGIKDFRERVEALNETSAKNNAGVCAQIESLANMNARLSDEARNLANALRANNKAAGNWGEAVFKRILEACGFIEGVHFRSQESFHDFSGEQSRLMPDFIIDLPEKRAIIVDSKLSLVDFVNYTNAEDVAIKKAHLDKFKKSVRGHLENFAGKYNNIAGIEGGFKIMFMPVEPAYDLAVAEDDKLLFDAYNKNVLIANPSTVMSLLKFAEIAYRNEAFAKNMSEISSMAQMLYERVELFLKRFEKLGLRVSQLAEEYEKAKLTLSSGSQSVMKTAIRFYEKSRKVIDGESANSNMELDNSDNLQLSVEDNEQGK